MVDHHIFSNALHCINLLVFLVLDQVDLSEGAPSDELEDLEIVENELGDVLDITGHLLPAVDGLGGGTG